LRLVDADSDAALLEKTRVRRPPAEVATPSRTTPDRATRSTIDERPAIDSTNHDASDHDTLDHDASDEPRHIRHPDP